MSWGICLGISSVLVLVGSEEQAAEPQESGGRAGLGGPKGRTGDGREEAHTKADLNSIDVQLLAELSN